MDKQIRNVAALIFILIFVCLLWGMTVKAGDQKFGLCEEENGDLYYYDKDGAMARSFFLTIEDMEGVHRYFFCADGKAAKGLKVTRNGYYYYFEEDGQMAISKLVSIENQTYYFGENGRAKWILTYCNTE